MRVSDKVFAKFIASFTNPWNALSVSLCWVCTLIFSPSASKYCFHDTFILSKSWPPASTVTPEIIPAVTVAVAVAPDGSGPAEVTHIPLILTVGTLVYPAPGSVTVMLAIASPDTVAYALATLVVQVSVS